MQIAGILIGGPAVLVAAWLAWRHRHRVRTWFQTRSRLHKAALAAGIGAVGLITAGAGLYNYNYVMHNNDFCSSCHIMDNAWNRFQVSAHKDLGCHTCHNFRTRVPDGGGVAGAKLAVTPGALGCAACHEMSGRILKWDIAADPHKGTCGSCHNPHKQEEPRAAFESCATAQCHASADTLTALHRGLGTHTLDQCGACHQAHSWKVKGSDCLACHRTIYDDKPPVRRARPPAAIREFPRPRHEVTPDSGILRQIAFRTAPRPVARRPSGRRAPQGAPPQSPARPAVSDTGFLHSRHRTVACTDCHTTSGSHGGLKFATPAGCLACHHGAKQTVVCDACHVRDSLAARPRSLTLRVSVRPDTQTRAVAFLHARHTTSACTACHGTYDRRSVVITCNDCHTEHHAASRDCAACHPTAKTGHARNAHEGCVSCHMPERLPAIGNARALCLACHQEQKAHYPARDCAGCHAIPDHPPARVASRR